MGFTTKIRDISDNWCLSPVSSQRFKALSYTDVQKIIKESLILV